MVTYIKPTDHLYCSPHGYPWFYIGITLDNYYCHSVYISKTRKEKVINIVYFWLNFTMLCMPLGDEKTRAAHYVSQLLLTKIFHPYIINYFNKTSWINQLDIEKFQPDQSPATITEVSITEINIMHNLTREINKIIMGITSTGSNTSDTKTNTNYPWCYNFKGYYWITWYW